MHWESPCLLLEFGALELKGFSVFFFFLKQKPAEPLSLL